MQHPPSESQGSQSSHSPQQPQILVVEYNSLVDDIFICSQCKIIFTSLPIFMNHKRQFCPSDAETVNFENTAVPEGHVNVSENKIDSKPTLEQSCRKDLQILDLTCKMCSHTFPDSKTLISHLKTHRGKPYQCILCSRCFSQNSHLKRHELSHKVWPEGISNTTTKNLLSNTMCYACMYCDSSFASYGQFRIHLKNHVSLKMFKCVQSGCCKLFTHVGLLLNHVACDHQNPTYLCPHCDQTFESLEQSSLHQQHKSNCLQINKSPGRRYKCSQCDAAFKTNEKLIEHLSLENHKKCCIHCSKVFTSDKRLRLHLQIHREDKPHQCNLCKQAFSMKKYLMSHLLKHSKRQYSCTKCNKKFKRKDLLQRHEKIHQKNKFMKCPFKSSLGCKMIFNRTDKLNLHVKQHTKQTTASSVNNVKKVSKVGSSTVEILIVPFEGSE